MNIFVNHIGYAPHDRKQVVIEGPSRLEEAVLSLINRDTGEIVFQDKPVQRGPVARWKKWNFLVLDFSRFREEGRYVFQMNFEGKTVLSEMFRIEKELLRETTVSDLLYYFKSMRSTGNYDRRDRAVPVYGKDLTVDAHGGWYDASGDTSKYLSHLSYANFLNPQQTPMVAWNMIEALQEMRAKGKLTGSEMEKRFLEEILQGSDFIMRMQDPSGFFYMTLFDQWSKDLKKRMLCSYTGQDGRRWETYQAGYRQGGGVAVALLARTAAIGAEGDFRTAEYLNAAVLGFDHLEEFNLSYLDDGKENVIDDYCALLAASELYAATGRERFLAAAEKRAASLTGRVRSEGPYRGWISADGADRPYFHAAEAGLPVLSLIRYLECTSAADREDKDSVLRAIKRIMEFELNITGEVNNPFGYARQFTKAEDREASGAFFIPHNNPSGYWWQGENARLASLAAAAVKTSRLFAGDSALAEKLRAYALDQLNWILGCNPYNMCMMQGHGANNPPYERDFINNPGGICNGITSGFLDEEDIDFAPEGAGQRGDHSWRWGEQWIPHAGWFLLAVSLL
ncbi:MAG: glycoside hydrolase family 9 protein [Spirochaetales bacterium]|nr:glycoside hydrolase family 9 protein [Spirochaetales bacterium]